MSYRTHNNPRRFGTADESGLVRRLAAQRERCAQGQHDKWLVDVGGKVGAGGVKLPKGTRKCPACGEYVARSQGDER